MSEILFYVIFCYHAVKDIAFEFAAVLDIYVSYSLQINIDLI